MNTAIYNHKGYYNGIDAVMMCDMDPKHVVDSISRGVGAFYPTTNETDTEEHLIAQGGKKYGKYIVVDCVSKICTETPLDLLGNEDLSNEFVDVWEVA